MHVSKDMYIHAFLIIFTNLWAGLNEEPETNNNESGLQHICLLLKKSFSLINRMPEIIDINKQLSYGKKKKEKKTEKGVVYSSVSFLYLIDV